MSFILSSTPNCALWKLKVVGVRQLWSSSSPVSSFPKQQRPTRNVEAFFFNPKDEPILKEALKEPVAFMGGMFAGLLRLDLNEDPLKEWVGRTVEASGITEDEIDTEFGAKPEEESPQQIEIE
ncbi:UPF0426 protein At1g28150, chloroplastic-like [Camellia sinensis]|uniref:UPF0426 protein At1g28150, chloroplastic-like n=1 Tax=Camellia sinensis TaxID=4442 RepID=UPI001036787E|nr:UPF0426 protein At1g28150, chloroplastic-like [Camellia sinensis]